MAKILTIIMLALFVGYHGTVYKVASGANSDREAWKGCKYGRHAEVEAKLRLPPSDKKTKHINLIVIRTDKIGNLKNSRPCAKCIEHLSNMKGYKLKYVYYSDEAGDIIERKFTELLLEENKHISKRFRI